MGGFDVQTMLRVIHKRNWSALITECGRDCSHLDKKLTKTEDTILHLAVSLAPLPVIRELLNLLAEGITVDVNSEGNNLLHLAAMRGEVEVCELVLQFGSKTKNRNGESALFLSVFHRNEDVFIFLFEKFISSYRLSTNKVIHLEDCISDDNENILHVAIRQGFIGMACIIVDNLPQLINMENTRGETPLHVLVTSSIFKSGCHFKIVKNCIYSCIPHQFRQPIGIRIAIARVIAPALVKEKKKHEELNYLLSKMLTFHSRRGVKHKKWNPLLTLDYERELDSEPIVSEKIPSPVILAVKEGALEIVEGMIDFFPGVMEEVDSEGKNLIFLAAEKRNIRIFQILVEANMRKSLLYEKISEQSNILHVAAKFFDSEQWGVLDAYIQMQLELKWFKFVKGLVPEQLQLWRNLDGKKPEEIFNETHQELVGKSAKWIESTAEVSGIIVSMLTSSAIGAFTTTPGGVDSKGIPNLVHRWSYKCYNYASITTIILGMLSIITFVGVRFSSSRKRFSAAISIGVLMAMMLSYIAMMTMLITIGFGKALAEDVDITITTYASLFGVFVCVMYMWFWQRKNFINIFWSTFGRLKHFD